MSSGRRKPLLRLGICLAVLALGFAAMSVLAGLREPPARQKAAERTITVRVVEVSPEDVRISLTGYGPVQVLDSVQIAPEVSGRIDFVHPDLEVGEVIQTGEVLFGIDDSSYRAEYHRAEAAVGQRQQEIDRLKLQKRLDQGRLQTLKRNVELARTEFERLRRLHGQAAMATQSEVDRAEQAMNSALERYEQLEQTVALAPIRIKEIEQALQAAKASRDLAWTNLQRCTVSAPFTGRITSATLEKGLFVSPGQAALTMADDSRLEIHVSLDSREARRWLRFREQEAEGTRGWFAGLQPVDCRILWTGDEQRAAWTGRLHRPVRFDEKNRMLTVAVRVSGREASRRAQAGLPLVEGMFCRVEIPGKCLEDVYRVPRESVSFDNKVYLAESGRLRTVEVSVARIQDGSALISAGLSAGDRVITTRLVDPLENSLLDVIDVQGGNDRP